MLAGHPPFVDDDPMGIYQKILGNKLSFPRGFDKYAKSLTKKLVTADLTKRYGCLKDGAKDIKSSKWFLGLNWDKLLRKQLPAPIKPLIENETDTSNFDAYPDSDEEAIVPIIGDENPFEDF